MNGQHLWAFLWLRWRLRINQLKRGGIANAVILAILTVAAIASAAILFVICLVVGLYALNDAPPAVLLYVLDGVVGAFLFLWMTGLIQELQRSEPLSLEKFLHLPVSLTSAFLINYLSSLPSVSLLWFLAALLGLELGLLYSRGMVMLWLLPMLAAFVLMVTALTYQFQGWLATMMANPRRRRTIIVVATMIFILLCQVPNLVNILHSRQNQVKQGPGVSLRQEYHKLQRARSLGKISHEEYRKRQAEIEKRQAEIGRAEQIRLEREEKEQLQRIEQTIHWLNLLLPPGWLPAGVEAAAEGLLWPVLLAIFGPTLIGVASLWRAYRTTLRLYTGQYTSGRAVPVSQPERDRTSRSRPAARRSSNLLEKKLPWLSEQASAIALAALRSLLRAPEAKMLLLSPLLLLVIFGSGFLAAGRTDVPEAIRPLFAFGAMVLVLFSTSYLLGNQFGLDRDGFRVYVLSPARRRDILLGKNLAIAPVVLAMGAAAAVFVHVIYPMRLDHFLALGPRFVSMYLLYCLPANTLSIFAPMRIAAGSFQPARPGAIAILLQMLFMFLCPPLLALTLLPLGIEWMAEIMDWRHGMPLDLIFSVVECAIIVCLYGLFLLLQGNWLQAREQRILQIVTTRRE